MSYDISENMTVAEIVTKYPQTRQLLDKLGVDYCCGGKHSLKKACDKAGLPTQETIQKIEKEIAAFSKKPAEKDWNTVSLTELAEHIIETHHEFLKSGLPRLEVLADKVYDAHKQKHGEMVHQLAQTLETLRHDIEMHLAKEEQILFPLVKQMEAFEKNQGPKPTLHCGTVDNPIRQMESEHDTAGDMLARMRNTTSDYRLPDDACESFKALYDGLQELEQDLHEHIHLENNILFPKSVELEKSICI